MLTSLKSWANSLTVDIATVAASLEGYLKQNQNLRETNEIFTSH